MGLRRTAQLARIKSRPHFLEPGKHRGLPGMVPENTIMAAPTHHNLAPSQTTPNKLATYQKWLQTIEKPLQTPQEPRGASFLHSVPLAAPRPCRPTCTTSSTPPSTISRASLTRSTSACATSWTAARSGTRPTARRPLPGKLPTASRVRTRTVCSDQARRTRSSTRRTVRPGVPEPAWTRRRRRRHIGSVVTWQCAGDGERSRRVHHTHGLP